MARIDPGPSMEFGVIGSALAVVGAIALIVSFTVPVDPDGMNEESVKMMNDAKEQGVKIHSANIMTMYFGPKFNKTMSMLQMCTASANKAREQTTAIDAATQIGLCPMIGHNGQYSMPFLAPMPCS